MRKQTMLWLRLILAVIFALIAFIFSEVIPESGVIPFNKLSLRVVVTLWFGLIGFGIFPDLARQITGYALSMVNFITEKVTTDVINQIMRLPRGSSIQSPSAIEAPIGGVTMNSPLILDTSAIIDGRVLDIAKAGFISGLVLVPTYVLVELQQVADSSDFLKRSRARRGFDTVEALKKLKNIRLEVWEKDIAGKTVDDKLVRFAKSVHGKIITTDFNLNKVATLSNVVVLNVNELSNAVKTLAIPGEQITTKIIHLGKDPKQGVGYFPDGTMIVLEDGAPDVGKDVKAEVTRVLQVAAGRMVFAKKHKALQ